MITCNIQDCKVTKASVTYRGVGMKFKLGGGGEGGADLIFSCIILLKIKNDPKN